MSSGRLEVSKPGTISSLLGFLAQLDRLSISYRLVCDRPEAIMVEITIPGEHWEVEFMHDGSIEIERYVSSGEILDESALEHLWEIVSAGSNREMPRA